MLLGRGLVAPERSTADSIATYVVLMAPLVWPVFSSCRSHDGRLHEPVLGIMRLVVGSRDGSRLVDPTLFLRTPLF